MYIDDVGRQGSLLADRTVTRMNLYTILGRSPKREIITVQHQALIEVALRGWFFSQQILREASRRGFLSL